MTPDGLHRTLYEKSDGKQLNKHNSSKDKKNTSQKMVNYPKDVPSSSKQMKMNTADDKFDNSLSGHKLVRPNDATAKNLQHIQDFAGYRNRSKHLYGTKKIFFRSRSENARDFDIISKTASSDDSMADLNEILDIGSNSDPQSDYQLNIEKDDTRSEWSHE